MAQPRNRIIMDLGDVKIDADPLLLSRLIYDLVNNEPFRRVFEADPVAALHGAGVKTPEEYAERITLEAIDQELAAFKERGTEAIAPGVGVMVDVGTSPGVNVGVEVAVNSGVVTATMTHSGADAVKAAELRRAARLQNLQKNK